MEEMQHLQDKYIDNDALHRNSKGEVEGQYEESENTLLSSIVNDTVSKEHDSIASKESKRKSIDPSLGMFYIEGQNNNKIKKPAPGAGDESRDKCKPLKLRLSQLKVVNHIEKEKKKALKSETSMPQTAQKQVKIN